jgi:peptide/nickel transport system permease protein
MAVDAIFSRDLVVLQAAVIVLTFTAIIGNLLADIAYGFFDPRIRYQ